MRVLTKITLSVSLVFFSLISLQAQRNGGPIGDDYTTLEKLEIKAADTYQDILDGNRVGDWKVLQSMIVKIANNLRNGMATNVAITNAYNLTVAQNPARQTSLNALKLEIQNLLNN